MLVTRTGVLAGKTVVAISTSSNHSLVLCSDGTVAGWGANAQGQLGNGSTSTALVPVLLNTSGVLAGKTITKISAGGNHSLVLCSDGTLAAWGWNLSGQLGNGTATDSSVPVLVNLTGVLAGKTVTDVTAGQHHSAALCSDGTIAT